LEKRFGKPSRLADNEARLLKAEPSLEILIIFKKKKNRSENEKFSNSQILDKKQRVDSAL